MTNGPPNPFRDPNWASIILGLGLAWSQTTTLNGTAYGRFMSTGGAPYYLVPAKGGSTPSAGDMWTLVTSVPGWCPEHLMTSGAATALLSGTSNSDGTVTYGGTTYKLQQFFVTGSPTMHPAAG